MRDQILKRGAQEAEAHPLILLNVWGLRHGMSLALRGPELKIQDDLEIQGAILHFSRHTEHLPMPGDPRLIGPI